MACDPAELHRIVRDPWKRPEVLRACFYFVGSDLCLGWDTVHPTTVTSFALKVLDMVPFRAISTWSFSWIPVLSALFLPLSQWWMMASMEEPRKEKTSSQRPPRDTVSATLGEDLRRRFRSSIGFWRSPTLGPDRFFFPSSIRRTRPSIGR